MIRLIRYLPCHRPVAKTQAVPVALFCLIVGACAEIPDRTEPASDTEQATDTYSQDLTEEELNRALEDIIAF